MTYVYVALYTLIIAGVYAVSYYLNHKTPLPAGCENLKAECGGCGITSCEMHPTHDIKEEE